MSFKCTCTLHECHDDASTDGCNSELCPSHFMNNMEQFNFPHYTPLTKWYPDLHDDFHQPMVLSAMKMTKISPDRVKESFLHVIAIFYELSPIGNLVETDLDSTWKRILNSGM